MVTEPRRRFPAPWIIEDNGACYVVSATGGRWHTSVLEDEPRIVEV
jgi:hypothetical protein